MNRSKPKATVLVADGAGGMVPVRDLRFDEGNPFRWTEIELSQDAAKDWLRALAGECENRRWSSSSLGQYARGDQSVMISGAYRKGKN